MLREAVARRSPTPVGLTASQARDAWLEFGAQEFRLPNRPDADGLLYQFGIFRFTGEPRFHLDLTRQFALPDSDEYLQVHLDVQFVPDDALRSLGRHEEWWWRDQGQALGVWAEALRGRGEWDVLREREPVAVDLRADET